MSMPGVINVRLALIIAISGYAIATCLVALFGFRKAVILFAGAAFLLGGYVAANYSLVVAVAINIAHFWLLFGAAVLYWKMKKKLSFTVIRLFALAVAQGLIAVTLYAVTVNLTDLL